MVNIESIHDITGKAYCDSPNTFWTGSDPNIVPIRVAVNDTETQLTVTYFTQQPVSGFVAHAMCGLFNNFSRLMFNINPNVSQRTGNGQYVFTLSTDITANHISKCKSNYDFCRHKNSLSNDPHNLCMSVRTFSRAFPFHFICDPSLKLVQIGSGLMRMFGDQSKAIGAHMSYYFKITQPSVDLNFPSIIYRINLVFGLQLYQHLSDPKLEGMELKGQMIHCPETHCLLFLGSPIVKGLQSMTSRGLYISDIPIHDATRDLILIEEQSRRLAFFLHLEDLEYKGRLHPKKLWLGETVKARNYDHMTMLFSDIVGFTAICSTATPIVVINMLNALYTQFDTETIGDAYCDRRPDVKLSRKMRIGLHSGNCLAGIVGVKMPRYCLFGSNVTLANKFESSSEAMRINLSPTTYRLLKDKGFYFTQRHSDCLPKECPSHMERISFFLDDYKHPFLREELSLSMHINKALQDFHTI
ncbi:unnamed protein product [Oppiella nova]|uniref:guanylate cyclase n=1 Tax=Oppiella nova TaxID=334625 RepID=A0A7R9LJ25_9ACAR|nr:unnamed protein product [Oppiella nova]CAG2164097.1 unnamed protein product [Oppiella nova]